MTPYVGPAAEGARAGATVGPSDVQDLVENALWRGGSGAREDIHLIGPALVVYFGCCGGTIRELPNVQRGHFRPDRSERIDLPGTRQILARKVPLFGLSKLKLLSYVSNTDYAGDHDPLFKNAEGDPLTEKACWGIFKYLGQRTGLPAWGLPTILRAAFVRWMEACPSDRVRLYLIGSKGVGANGVSAEPDPQFTKVRENLEAAHPLAKLTREELARPGAVRRAFPNPHFPTLSREALADMKTRKRNQIVCDEVRRAVRTAVASGKSVRQTAQHYRISVDAVRSIVAAGADPDPGAKPSQTSYRRTMLEIAHSGPTATEFVARANEKLGIDRTRSHLKRTARRLGIEFAGEPHGFWRKHEAELRKAAETDGPRNISAVKQRLAAMGIETSSDNVRYALKTIGIRVRDEKRDAFEKSWPAVRQQLTEDPSLKDKHLAQIVFDQTGHKLGPKFLSRLLAARPDLPAREGPVRGPRKAISERFERAWPSVRAAMIENPRLTDDEAIGIMTQITGRGMSKITFNHLLAIRQDVPPRAKLRRRS